MNTDDRLSGYQKFIFQTIIKEQQSNDLKLFTNK